MARGNIFSATEMLTELKAGDFAPALSVMCAMKHDEKNDKVLLINLQMSCESWISIPLDVIDTIEYIRNFRCDDHSHPVVLLTFAKPSTEEGRAFSAIAGQLVQMSYHSARKTLPADGGTYEECAACLNRCSKKPTREERLDCYANCCN